MKEGHGPGTAQSPTRPRRPASRPGVAAGDPGPGGLLRLQRLAGNRAVAQLLAPVVQRVLREGTPTQPGKAVTGESDLQRDAELFDDRTGNTYRFKGLDEKGLVVLDLQERKFFTYDARTDAYAPYGAGPPAFVEMHYLRTVNLESLAGAAGKHTGVVFTIKLFNEALQSLQVPVQILEVVTQVEASGFFSRAQTEVQKELGTWTPTEPLIDFNGISAEPVESGSKEEKVSPPPGTGLVRTETAHEKAFQYFVVEGGERKQVIPNSGFLIEKTFSEGILKISKKPQRGSVVSEGVTDFSGEKIKVRFH